MEIKRRAGQIERGKGNQELKSTNPGFSCEVVSEAMERRITVNVSLTKPLSEQLKIVSHCLEEMSEELELPEDYIVHLSTQRVLHRKKVRELTYRVLWGFRGVPVGDPHKDEDFPETEGSA